MPADTGPQAERNPGWLQRNWRWLVPTSVLALFALSAAAVVGLAALIKSFAPYPQIMAAVRADETVIAVLGEPIEDGLFFDGRIETSNGRGAANLVIPLAGSRADGRAWVNAVREQGQWRYTTFMVEFYGTDMVIDLRPPTDPSAGQP